MVIFTPSTSNKPVCPLCDSVETAFYYQDKNRPYFECSLCKLVFVDRQYHLSSELEKAEYDKHQNDPNDAGYRQFLTRTTTPLFKHLSANSLGLDFGCGPGPAVSEIMQEHGFRMVNYDLYYFNFPQLLEKQYHFVTMTEVIEHLSEPNAILSKLKSILTDKGVLAIMTKRVTNQQAFSHWHYKNDLTHISFYSIATFEWIAAKFDWKLEIIDKDVIFLHNH